MLTNFCSFSKNFFFFNISLFLFKRLKIWFFLLLVSDKYRLAWSSSLSHLWVTWFQVWFFFLSLFQKLQKLFFPLFLIIVIRLSAFSYRVRAGKDVCGSEFAEDSGGQNWSVEILIHFLTTRKKEKKKRKMKMSKSIGRSAERRVKSVISRSKTYLL